MFSKKHGPPPSHRQGSEVALEAPPRRALEAHGLTSGRACQSHLLDPCWTKITISKPEDAVAVPGQGISTTCVVAKPALRTHGIRIPARDAHIPHKVKAPRASRPRGLHFLARPAGFEPVAFGFVEDIHVSSNTRKNVQACANTGSVSDEKSKNVQAHASLSKDFAGSLLDGMAADGEDGRSDRSLLSVRQVAKLLGCVRQRSTRSASRGSCPTSGC
jgi:hypothetical protein